jgi:hypothetical protein
LDRENEEDCLGSSVKNQLRLTIVETKLSWEWSLPETADEADGSYAQSLRRKRLFFSRIERQACHESANSWSESMQVGKKLLELLAKCRKGNIRKALFRTPPGKKAKMSDPITL